MQKLTGIQILDLIEEKEISWDNLGNGDMDVWDDNPEFGEVEIIDEYGGEDCGSTYYKIYYFENHDVYIKINGWYQSYVGVEFTDAPYEVKPIQKTITVFE